MVGDPLHGFADDRPAAILDGDGLLGHEARELDDDEGELAAPGLVPGLDHVAEDPLVGHGLTGVGFALIPQGALEAVTDERSDHAVPVHVRAVGPDRLGLGVGLGLGDAVGDALVFLLLPALGFRLGIVHAARAPGFGAGAADRGVDDADGLLELGAHGDREVVTGGGEAVHGGRTGDLPGTLHVLGGVRLRRAGDGEDADAVVDRTGARGGGAARVAHDPFHVGLTGADPDLADDDVLGDVGLGAGLDHQILAFLRGLEAGQGRLEDAVGTGGGGGLSGAVDDLDGGARLGLAVDVGLTGLEHGMVREDGRELEVGGLDQRREEEQERG